MNKSLLPLLLTLACVCPLQAMNYIQLDFSRSALSNSQKQIITKAADYWNSVITGIKASDPIRGYTPHLTVSIGTPSIDGAGDVDASTYVDSVHIAKSTTNGIVKYSRLYVDAGTIEFDSADIASMVQNKLLYQIAIHEMGHLLGIGNQWKQTTTNSEIIGDKNLYNPSAPSTTFMNLNVGAYTGKYALAKWRTEFNRPKDTFVPVEKTGGSGTANMHWVELPSRISLKSTFNNFEFSKELMTGWHSTSTFVSEMTLGALEDLGFNVDYSKAGIINTDNFSVTPNPFRPPQYLAGSPQILNTSNGIYLAYKGKYISLHDPNFHIYDIPDYPFYVIIPNGECSSNDWEYIYRW